MLKSHWVILKRGKSISLRRMACVPRFSEKAQVRQLELSDDLSSLFLGLPVLLRHIDRMDKQEKQEGCPCQSDEESENCRLSHAHL